MKEHESKVGFVLLKIVTEQFAIVDEAHEEGKEATINTQVQFAANAAQKMLGAKVAFRFVQTKVPFLIIEASCHFRITDEAWDKFSQKEEGKLIVPAGFMAHLAMLTVGTARGILHAKTETTKFSQYIVPTINVAVMIKEDIIFDLNKLPVL